MKSKIKTMKIKTFAQTEVELTIELPLYYTNKMESYVSIVTEKNVIKVYKDSIFTWKIDSPMADFYEEYKNGKTITKEQFLKDYESTLKMINNVVNIY